MKGLTLARQDSCSDHLQFFVACIISPDVFRVRESGDHSASNCCKVLLLENVLYSISSSLTQVLLGILPLDLELIQRSTLFKFRYTVNIADLDFLSDQEVATQKDKNTVENRVLAKKQRQMWYQRQGHRVDPPELWIYRYRPHEPARVFV